MRYDSSWLQHRLDSIHKLVTEDSQLKDLRFSGSGVGGYQVYIYMGGPIKVVQLGTLRECLAYLDGILFLLTELKNDVKKNNLVKGAMGSTLPIGPMPQIVNNAEVIQLAFKWGFRPDNSDYSASECLAYLDTFVPPGHWVGFDYDAYGEDILPFGVWPDGSLTD